MSNSIIDTLLKDNLILYTSTCFFISAVLHTVFVNKISLFGLRFEKNSVRANLFHFLGEVEIVFGFWAFVFLIVLSLSKGMLPAIQFLDEIDFKEAIFVFVIMCMSATKAVMFVANVGIQFIAKVISKIFFVVPFRIALFFSIFTFGTLSGSLITEPVAMTVSALLLKDYFFDLSHNRKFKNAMLALLFVNISIGGTCTHFAAPPILMVASAWGWQSSFMLAHFGWKALIAILICTVGTAFYFRKEILMPDMTHVKRSGKKIPLWIVASNMVFLLLCILYHSYISFLVFLFALFIGWFNVTKGYQKELKIRESFLVGFFLAGIVILGSLQRWWLEPLVNSLNSSMIFLSTIGLTAVADNAALTFLGTLIPDLSFAEKYMLVAGAVTGGGLTVIANAPNPIGYGILNKSYGLEGIHPFDLFLWALPFTVIAGACFFFF